MTNKDAFVSGINLFCKTAGFDGEDAAQIERLLLMPPGEAEPIVKRAAAGVKCVSYVRAGVLLEKCAQTETLPPAVRSAIASIQDPQQRQALERYVTGRSDGAQPGGWAGQLGQNVGQWAGSAQTPPQTQAQTQPSQGGWLSQFRQGLGSFISGLQRGIRGPQAGRSAEAGESLTTGKQPEVDEGWDEDYEGSQLKGLGMPKHVYRQLRMTHKHHSDMGTATMPLEDYLNEQWELRQFTNRQYASRQAMRRLGLDMPPGELARMTDADIAVRARRNPGIEASLRRARDLALDRETMHGGVSARMGRGFVTQHPASRAAAQTSMPTGARSAQSAASPQGGGVQGTAAAAPVASPATPTPIRPWSARGTFGGATAIGSGGPAGTASYEEV
jgi:hypothetical protein